MDVKSRWASRPDVYRRPVAPGIKRILGFLNLVFPLRIAGQANFERRRCLLRLGHQRGNGVLRAEVGEAGIVAEHGGGVGDDPGRPHRTGGVQRGGGGDDPGVADAEPAEAGDCQPEPIRGTGVFEVQREPEVVGAGAAEVVGFESATELTLLTADGQTLKVKKSDIEERQKGLSAMPADLPKHLTNSEIRDLIEFLAQQKREKK